MTDFFEQTFSDLDEFYPGSKRKRKEPVKQEAPVVTNWEDDFFLKYLPNGQQVKMYTLGSVAKALNRSVQSLRYWIDEGHIPAPPYRLPSVKGKNGKEYAGRKLYSKRMVEALVEIFKSAGLLGVARVDWVLHRNLSDKITESWDKIRAEETTTN